MDTSKETFKAFQQDDVLSTADVASSVVIKPEEEYAYGFIIEVLTRMPSRMLCNGEQETSKTRAPRPHDLTEDINGSQVSKSRLQKR